MSQPKAWCQYAGDEYKLAIVEVEQSELQVRYMG